MSSYRIDFDETESTYFMIKEEKFFDKYMKIWEKVTNIIQKLMVNLYIVKNVSNSWKTFNTKETFQCFYRKVIPITVILIDSVYRKDENYYPKVFLKNIIHSDDSNENISTKEIRMKKIKCINLYLKVKWIVRSFCFWGFVSSFVKCRKTFF